MSAAIRAVGLLWLASSSVGTSEAATLAPQGGAPSSVRAGPLGSCGSPRIPRSQSFSAQSNGTDVALGGTNEPAVAVNPLNPNNVAISSLYEYRLSQDGGLTWTAPMASLVPPGYGQDGAPSLTFDSHGRLYYAYSGSIGAGDDMLIARLDPVTGAYLSGPVKVTTSGMTGTANDKPWVAADRQATSPFADRLYMVWNEFLATGGTRVMTSSSSDQGATWSIAFPVSSPSEGFAWPAHVAVAPNGDVYVSYHSQPGFNGVGEAGGNPNGTSGRIYVVRSTNGGVSYPQKSQSFTAGRADITFNIQSSPGSIPGASFWTQGSCQPWILPDPQVPGNVYVVAADDADNNHTVGDAADIYIARSTNNGVSWSLPIRVDHDAGTSFQLFPTAAIDDTTGDIAVMWYDNRLGGVNGSGSSLLDVYYCVSHDHGLTFGSDVKIDDTVFDPDLGAAVRFPGPPPTLRIGEYDGIAMGCGNIHMTWCGNTVVGQQTVTDSFVAPTASTPFCYGDGSLATACPCGNTGATAHGCQNSAMTGGAVLAGCGSTSPDMLTLTVSGELASVLTIFLQGDANLGSGTVFGDGVLCANGTLTRLYTKNAGGGYITVPSSGDLSISARSAASGDTITPGSMRYYQAYYRDPMLAFCANPPGNSWNVSSGIIIAW